jgi:flagellar biosynthesis protein FlhA
VRIFESLSLRAKVSTDHDGLVEAARTALGPAIATTYASAGVLAVLTLDPQLEQHLLESVRPAEGGAFLALDGHLAEGVVADIARLGDAAEQQGSAPVLACSPPLRAPLSRLLRSGGRTESVMSYPELAGSPARIETMGVVSGVYAGVA